MKSDKRPSRQDDEKKYGNEKPISLHPLAPEEALRRAMSVSPPKKPERPTGRKPAKSD